MWTDIDGDSTPNFPSFLPLRTGRHDAVFESSSLPYVSVSFSLSYECRRTPVYGNLSRGLDSCPPPLSCPPTVPRSEDYTDETSPVSHVPIHWTRGKYRV